MDRLPFELGTPSTGHVGAKRCWGFLRCLQPLSNNQLTKLIFQNWITSFVFLALLLQRCFAGRALA
jgi:hypothetical protein